MINTKMFSKINIKNTKAFTLVEVMITLSIIVLVVSCVFGISVVSQKFYAKAENRAEILQNGRIVLERLSREIRQANIIVSQLPLSEIEFEDGHTPSPFAYLGSNYFYIRYFLDHATKEVRRQYKAYCFEPCDVCASYVRWNDIKIIDGAQVNPLTCVLEDRVVGEFVESMSFWGSGLVNISLDLAKNNENIELGAQIAGRNF